MRLFNGSYDKRTYHCSQVHKWYITMFSRILKRVEHGSVILLQNSRKHGHVPFMYLVTIANN